MLLSLLQEQFNEDQTYLETHEHETEEKELQLIFFLTPHWYFDVITYFTQTSM